MGRFAAVVALRSGQVEAGELDALAGPAPETPRCDNASIARVKSDARDGD